MPSEILSPELISEHSPSLASWHWRIVSLCGRMTHKHTFVCGGLFSQSALPEQKQWILKYYHPYSKLGHRQ